MNSFLFGFVFSGAALHLSILRRLTMKIELNEATTKIRKPWAWTDRNQSRAGDVTIVLRELDAYLPLTIRQIYYRLISKNLHEQGHWIWKSKPVDIYKALVPLIKWMRIDGKIGWGYIHDEHRTITGKRGWSSAKAFIRYHADDFLVGYNRCLAQGQPRHIEIWLEKQALLHIVEPVADEFCRRVVVCRGYSSVTFQIEFYNRATKAIDLGQIPTILYFGDWDPSGVNMPYAAAQTLQDELGLAGFEIHRMGINPDHFADIQANPVPIKQTDSRSKAFVAQYGDTAYELDAFHPEDLEVLVRESIRQFTNMDAMFHQRQIGSKEHMKVMALQERLQWVIDEEVEKFEQDQT